MAMTSTVEKCCEQLETYPSVPERGITLLRETSICEYMKLVTSSLLILDFDTVSYIQIRVPDPEAL